MLSPKNYAITPGSCVPDFDLAVILGQPLGVILDWLCEGRFEGAFYHHKHRCWYVPRPVKFNAG